VVAVAQAQTFLIGGTRPVHRLALGTFRLVGPDGFGPPPDREEGRRVLRRAVELGANLIDTADSYGPGYAEELIAEALAPYPDSLVIATKGGSVISADGEIQTDGSPTRLSAACDASRVRLRLDRIPLYQLHVPDPQVPIEVSVAALNDLREEGKVEHIGLSNVSVDQLAAARGVAPIAAVQNRYSLAARAASEEVVDYCEEHGIAFLPWNPLGFDPTSGLVDELALIARDQGVTWRQVALRWLVQRSPVIVAIPGPRSVAELEEDLGAASVELSGPEFEALDRLSRVPRSRG
jgi:aryl-alcohol dehydrogenase-like predicted oxidoreductase